MHDQSNLFYAIALSVVVLITWQYFFATSFKPAAPGTSQISAQNGAVISGAGTAAANAEPPYRPRRRNRPSRSRGSRRLRGRNASPSKRPG